MKHLSRFLFVVFALMLVSSAVAQTCYYQVWSDEFNNTGAPSSANWKAEIGAGGWGNNELQYYTGRTENANCSNGTLKITAIKESYEGSSYTSARLISYGKQSFKYGKIEARIKMPYGKGIWPAFWMLGTSIMNGTNWPACGEIDVVEMVGGGINDKVVVGTPHWADASGNHAQYGGNTTNATALSNDFHLYGIEWTSSYIRWYFNGVKYHEMSTTPSDLSEFQKDFFLLLNLAVGGNWPGSPDGTTVFPQVLEVDYVRAYSTTMPAAAVKGDALANVGQALSFTVDKPLDGVVYTWTVPADAVITSGQGTSTINVTWGSSSGSVQCSAKAACAAVALTSLKVETIIAPTGSSYDFPLVAGGASVWTKGGASNGIFDISANSNSNLDVAFEYNGNHITDYLSYQFPSTLDLTQFSQLHIALKPLSGNLPRNVRVDLLDTDGNVNSSDLFVVSPLNPKHNFYIYSHNFNPSALNWKIGRIKSAKIYVNSGVSNLVTKGSIEIGSLQLSKEGNLGLVTTPSDTAYILQPQDGASNLLWSGNAAGGNSVTPVLNGTSVDVTWNIVDGASFAKLIYNLPNSLDLGYYNQIELKFLKDAGSDLPSNISVAVIDSNRVANANDSWSISDYSATNASGYLHHAFGNTSNGGEWLPCRTRQIELTINKDVATAASGKFTIVSQRIVKEPVNTSWHTNDKAIDNRWVYPNPASDVINLDLSSYTGSALITITDLSGRLLIQDIIAAGSISQFAIASLSQGAYLLNVEANNASKSIVLIKQ